MLADIIFMIRVSILLVSVMNGSSSTANFEWNKLYKICKSTQRGQPSYNSVPTGEQDKGAADRIQKFWVKISLKRCNTNSGY